MNLNNTIELLAGGPGSGCNPKVAKPRCGRKTGSRSNRFVVPTPVQMKKSVDRLLEGEKPQSAVDRFVKTLMEYSGEYSSVSEQPHEIIRRKFIAGIRGRKVPDDIMNLITALENAPKVNKELYRGLVVDDAYKFANSLKTSGEFTIPVSSATSNKRIAHYFAEGGPDNTYKLIFKIKSGSRALNITNTSGSPQEEEYLISGTFKVVDVHKEKGVAVATIVQTKTIGLKDKKTLFLKIPGGNEQYF